MRSAWAGADRGAGWECTRDLALELLGRDRRRCSCLPDETLPLQAREASSARGEDSETSTNERCKDPVPDARPPSSHPQRCAGAVQQLHPSCREPNRQNAGSARRDAARGAPAFPVLLTSTEHNYTLRNK